MGENEDEDEDDLTFLLPNTTGSWCLSENDAISSFSVFLGAAGDCVVALVVDSSSFVVVGGWTTGLARPCASSFSLENKDDHAAVI